eukprot:1158681-Pelagomonas_calceolata.AAC.3
MHKLVMSEMTYVWDDLSNCTCKQTPVSSSGCRSFRIVRLSSFPQLMRVETCSGRSEKDLHPASQQRT